MITLKEQYDKTVAPALMEKYGLKNKLAAPEILKVVVNIGTGPGLSDAKFNEVAEDTLTRITGQKPVKTIAKKSISNFKVREGQMVGMVVTLRGPKMYDFIAKLIHVALPRVRDFRGIEDRTVDQNGNLNLGFKENIVFPEIKSDEVEKIHGLQVTVVTNAKSKDKGLDLFRLLGFPFTKKQ